MVHGGGSRGGNSRSGGGGNRNTRGNSSSARTTPTRNAVTVATNSSSRSAAATTTSAIRSGGGTRNNTRSPGETVRRTPPRSAVATQTTTRTTTTSTTTRPTTTTTSGGGRRNTTTTTRDPVRIPASTHINNNNNNHNNASPSRRGRMWSPLSRRREDLEEPLLIRPSQDEEEEDSNCCHGCAFLCCVTVLGCLGCCCSPLRRTKSTVPLLCVTLILFGILMVMSGYKQTLVFNAGESRQVKPSWLTRAMDVQVTTPHTTVEVDLYAIPGNCPPLTGPKVSVHREIDMNIQPGDFQYDYIYLNKGSRVEAGLYQLQGTSEVYMLKGQDKVSILQASHSEDEDDWLDNLLQAATKQWTVRDYYQQITARFRADKSDVYTLVYDNPYQDSGHLLTDLWLDLTTYNLKGYDPVCKDVAFYPCGQKVEKEFSRQCLLLDTSSAYGEGEVVSVKIAEYRDYAFIVLISLVPTVLAIAWELWSCLKEQANRRSWGWPRRNSTQEEVPATTSSREATTSTDPASAPPQPSAPPASQDADIPIATAQVVDDPEAPAAAASVPVEPVPAPVNEKK